MKHLLLALLFFPLLGFGQAPVNGGTQVTETPKQADSFVDSIGVNTHITYTGGDPYVDFRQDLIALTNLGVRHIRDFYQPTSVWGSSYPGTSAYYMDHQQLAAAGIDTDYLVSCNYSGNLPSATDIESFAGLVEDMASLEAANEPDDNSGCVFGSYSTWQAGVEAQLPILGQAGSSLGVPVLGPAMVVADSAGEIGNQSANVQYCNIHFYAGERTPETTGAGNAHGVTNGYTYPSIPWWQAEVTGTYTDNSTSYTGYLPNGNCMITESGYLSAPKSLISTTVSEAAQAHYAVRTLLAAYAWGIKRTFLFELFDDCVDYCAYGLMHGDHSAKPAYRSIQTLISLLSDKGPSFTPTPLTYTVSGSTTNIQHLLFQKRDGSWWLALWNNSQLWDPANYVAKTVNMQTVTISIAGGPVARTAYQFLSSGGAQPMNLGNEATASLQVGGGLSLIRIQ